MKTVGVDMVYLSAKPDEFRVNDACAFMYRGNARGYGEAPEIWGVSGSGQPLTGTLFVNRGKGGHDATVQIDNHGLTVQFNPSKLVHPYELTADVRPSVETVKRLMQTLTVDVDVDTMRLSRVDLTKQAVMSTPIEAFTGAFGALNGKRMKQRAQYPDGFTVGNKQRQVVFYDKHREQLLHDPNTQTPENLLRCEARFRKDALTNGRNGLGVGVLRDLVTADPYHLTDAYNRNLLTNVFRTSDGVQLTIDYGHEIDVLEALISTVHQPSKAVDKYIHTAGVEHLLSTFGSTVHFRQVLMKLGVPRRTAYRIEATIRQTVEQKRFLDRARGQKDSIASALDTLIRTFAA